MAVKTLIQVRRGSTGEWAAGTIVLSAGEWGYDTTTGRYKIGDGTTAWNSLTYAATLPTDFTGASGIGLSKGTNGSTIAISVTGIPSSSITDFNSAVDARVTAGSVSSEQVMDIVGSGLIEGSNIDLTYSGHQLTIAVSGIGTNIQAYDAGLASIAGLTTGSGNYLYATASDVYTTGVITAFGRSLVDDVDASAGRTTLGVVIGTDVQAYDADLAAIAGLTSAADKGIQFTGTGTAAVFDLTTAGKALLDDVDASAQRTTLGLAIGTNVQAYDAELAAIAGLTSAADKGIQFTGTGTAAVFDLTTAGKALLDDADASAQRTTLGLVIGTDVAPIASPTFTGTVNAAALILSGDLTVNGTASFVNSDNLYVKDKFILINSGSNTLADSGIIVAYSTGSGSGPIGSAIFLEAASTGTYGRWAFAYDVSGSATAVTADEYAVSAKIGQGSGPGAATPTWGGSTNGTGNMWLTTAGDIYIYS